MVKDKLGLENSHFSSETIDPSKIVEQSDNIRRTFFE